MNQTIHLLSDTLSTINPDVAYLIIFILTLIIIIDFVLTLRILKIMSNVIHNKKKDKEQNSNKPCK